MFSTRKREVSREKECEKCFNDLVEEGKKETERIEEDYNIPSSNKLLFVSVP
jgi:hypothetical protein